MRNKAILQNKLRRILSFGVVTLVVALLLNVYARTPFHPLQLLWALFGVLIGAVEQFFFTGRIAQAPVWAQLLLRIAIIPLIALTLVSVLMLMGVVPAVFKEAGITTIAQLWTTRTGLVANSLIVAAGVILFMEMERMVGTQMFRRFLLGRYIHPKRETRIVMFMDLVDSTAHTERLGDEKYFAMLNQVYARMAAPVLASGAEILKYIGDEVVFTWNAPNGRHDGRCLDLFFDIEAAIAKDARHFQKQYGMVPRFRAGMHYGEVITAQIGVIKRTIDHSGDAMNTCARIAGSAKGLGVALLASRDLLNMAGHDPSRFTFGPGTQLELKGKVNTVEAVPVERRG